MPIHRTLLSLFAVAVSVYRASAEDVTTTIDDSSPDIKHVSGTWVQFKGAEYYNGTETLTREARATTMYIFNGTSIAVFGTQCDPDGNTTVSTYSVDGDAPSKYTVPPNIPCNQNFVNFYTSPPLANGQHVLQITNLNDGAWYFLDFLKVTAPAPSPTKAPVVEVSATPSRSPTTRESRRPSKIGTAAIVGIVLGIAVLAAIIAIGVLLWYLRRAKSRSTHPYKAGEEEASAEEVESSNVTPYVVDSSIGQSSTSRGFGHSKAPIPRLDDTQYTASSSGEPSQPSASLGNMSQVQTASLNVPQNKASFPGEPSTVSTGTGNPRPSVSLGDMSRGSFTETASHESLVDRRVSTRTRPPSYEN